MIAPPDGQREPIRLFPNADTTLKDDALLTWDWVEDQLTNARNYWVCSVSPDSPPHARPLWGAYLDHALYFDGFFRFRWFRNLAANPLVSVHLESAVDVVIVEGHVEVTESDELAQRIADAYAVKYAPYTPEAEPGGYVLRPHKVYAWRASRPEDSGTRWTFKLNA